jgi:hypothetical protein
MACSCYPVRIFPYKACALWRLRSPTWKGDDLACLLIHSDPDPVWSGLPLHEAPQLICLNL